MKAVRVTYTVKPEYVETNKTNIQTVMNELNRNPIKGMWYRAFLLEDGQSFMHINVSDDEETMNKLNEVEQFNTFRAALKASGPVAAPKAEKITPV